MGAAIKSIPLSPHTDTADDDQDVMVSNFRLQRSEALYNREDR